MNFNEVKSIQEYLYYFEEKICPNFLNERPKVAIYYKALKAEMYHIEEQSQLPFLERMRILLKLDAKLQILYGFAMLQTELIDGLELNENEVIQMTENDCSTYYREILGKRTSDHVPWKLSCLGDQD